MKLLCSLLILLIFPAGCANLPRIEAPASLHGAASAPDCGHLFARGRWQFVHTIEATPPGGQKQTLIGISTISSERRTIDCVLMTIEGLALFEARYDGRSLLVRRAVGLLSANGFAEGLTQDILLIFFAPENRLQKTGRFADGAKVCRYAKAEGEAENGDKDGNAYGDGEIIDIIARPRGVWQIRSYTARGRLTRTITFTRAETDSPQGFAPRIELQAHGLAGYRLDMSLVEAQRLAP